MCSIFKMKCLALIVRLDGHNKVFRYIVFNEEKSFLIYISLMLQYFNRKKIDMHLWSRLQYAFSGVWIK